jgi:hypothetical protein
VLIVAVVGIGLSAAGTARAGTYTVHTCKAPDGSKAEIFWTLEPSHSTGFFTGNACPGGYMWMDLVSGAEHPGDDYIRANFLAPEGTEVTAYSLWRSVQLTDPYRYDFHELKADGGLEILERCFGDQGCTFLGSYQDGYAESNRVQGAGRSGVTGLSFSIYCRSATPGPACPVAAPAVNFQLHRADVTVTDPYPPTLVLPPSGPLVDPSAALNGQQQVWVSASDRGGGVQDLQFEVDGKVVASSTIDDNGGHCRQPYTMPQPCKSEVKGTATLDTTQLSDGRHRLRLLLTDATGTNVTAWGPITIRTSNGACDPKPRSEALHMKAAIAGRKRSPKARSVRYGKRLRVNGRLTRPDGTPVAGAQVCVAARNDAAHSPLRPARTVVTDADGRFTDTLRRGPSRRVYLVTRVADGAVSDSVMVHVRAPVRLHAAPRRLFNGQVLTLGGRLRGRPIPRRGVLVELQVRKRGGWQTFATTRARRKGRYRFRYRFTSTTGLQRYRFRARVPEQGTYPYAAGVSHPISVTVQG